MGLFSKESHLQRLKLLGEAMERTVAGQAEVSLQ